MTQKEAIASVLADADKRGVVLSSDKVKVLSLEMMERENSLKRKRNEYNVLSARNAGSRVMRPITTLNALTQPVLRDLVTMSCAEFLGEEYWMSLKTQSERLNTVRAFNTIRERITRGMC